MSEKKILMPEETAALEAKKAVNKAKKDESDAAQKVANAQNVKTVYKNSKGEYFTEISYAIASESGKRENIATFKFD
jgi:hypothetical protein